MSQTGLIAGLDAFSQTFYDKHCTLPSLCEEKHKIILNFDFFSCSIRHM